MLSADHNPSVSFGIHTLFPAVSKTWPRGWETKRRKSLMNGVCVCFAVTPPDLMDPGSTMWHPSHRKSSCSSCSQASFSDGAAPRGCNHERWEGLLGNTYYSSLVPNRELQPVTKRKTIMWHLPDWCENVFRKLADKPVRWNGLKLGLKKQAVSLFVPYGSTIGYQSYHKGYSNIVPPNLRIDSWTKDFVLSDTLSS